MSGCRDRDTVPGERRKPPTALAATHACLVCDRYSFLGFNTVKGYVRTCSEQKSAGEAILIRPRGRRLGLCLIGGSNQVSRMSMEGGARRMQRIAGKYLRQLELRRTKRLIRWRFSVAFSWQIGGNSDMA